MKPHPYNYPYVVPAAPLIRAIPYYSADNNLLIAINVTFNKTVELTSIIMITKLPIIVLNYYQQDSFDISDEVDGSANSYTITYADSMVGTICSTVEIQASLCNSHVCGHQFEVATSSCVPSANITITVFATNVLGSGQTSSLITIGKMIIIIIFFFMVGLYPY